jgi:23S rRNA (pseudouridine1915-N3)-methyltransferase
VLLHIIARGKIGRSPESELTDRYLKRISWPTKVTELPDRGGVLPDAPASTITVVLDERGQALSSMDLAKKLEKWRDTGRREARFLLGAADGHEEELRGKADLLLSFGPATWPHMLARAMLAEQLFRATSILANHPYHREG